jgi:hypothetical protein
MANYLLVYKGGAMGNTEEERQKSMAAWGEWMHQCGESLVDPGNPCSVSKAVTSSGVGEVKGEPVTGYSIIKADNIDQAVKAAQMVPLVVDGSGSVDVYETFDAM